MLDLVVIVAAVFAAVGGYRLGFVARALSWVGLGSGLFIASHYIPSVVSGASLHTPGSRLLLAVAVMLAASFAGELLGFILGQKIHQLLPMGPIRRVDQGVGAAAGLLGVMALLWMLIPSLTAVPGTTARITENSVISRWLSTHVSQPPNALQSLRQVVGDEPFPQVFNSLRSGGAAGAPPSKSPLPPQVATAVADSTVKVQGQACQTVQDGSGFAVGPNLVVTNAHVVAGEPAGQTQVLTYAGRTLSATVVLFDPNRDLALLRVPGLNDRPLPVTQGQVGQEGAVLGHPNGQDALAVQPARVSEQIQAVGSNLYGTAQTRRSVYVLASFIQPGDSGAPLMSPTGTVVGVAFAVAEGESGTAYALTSVELDAVLGEPHQAAVSTGRCLGG